MTFLQSQLTYFHTHIPIQWFLFRETYMTRIDKTEDKVTKVFREYQDNWCKYAESLEKDPGNVKVHSITTSRFFLGGGRGHLPPPLKSFPLKPVCLTDN